MKYKINYNTNEVVEKNFDLCNTAVEYNTAVDCQWAIGAYHTMVDTGPMAARSLKLWGIVSFIKLGLCVVMSNQSIMIQVRYHENIT